MKPFWSAFSLALCGIISQPVFAHHMVETDEGVTQHHRATKSKSAIDPWHLLEMAMTPAYAFSANVRMYLEGEYRIIQSNGIPNHTTGEFPNAGNPNTISEQSYVFRM